MSDENITKWPRRLAWWLFLLALVVVSWQTSYWGWAVYLGAEDRPQADPASATASPAGKRIANYPAWQLFGQAKREAATQAQVIESAPETRLRLDLYGVVVGDGNQSGGAIIAERGKGAEYFRVDDRLPGGVRLAAVYPDKVLLDRNGVSETLSFDDRDRDGGIQAVSQPAVNTAEDFVSVAAQRLQQDAGAALGSVGLQPAAEGGLPEGYVFNGNNALLNNAGLQQGDIIRSVNGHTLGNIEQDRTMIQQFYESGLLEVEVERDGAIFSISYPLR